MNVKYIRTSDNAIIVFPEFINHDTFRHLKPKSAGFIAIGSNGKNEPIIECYGKSISLDMESDPRDTDLARSQILGYEY